MREEVSSMFRNSFTSEEQHTTNNNNIDDVSNIHIRNLDYKHVHTRRRVHRVRSCRFLEKQ